MFKELLTKERPERPEMPNVSMLESEDLDPTYDKMAVMLFKYKKSRNHSKDLYKKLHKIMMGKDVDDVKLAIDFMTNLPKYENLDLF